MTLANDLDPGIQNKKEKEKVFRKEIHIRNMNALSLNSKKLWPMLKFIADKQRGRVKNSMPPIYRYGGIKNRLHSEKRREFVFYVRAKPITYDESR